MRFKKTNQEINDTNELDEASEINQYKNSFFASFIIFLGKYRFSIGFILLGAAIVYPLFFKTQYLISVGINVLLFAHLAMSLNLITGFMGITSLGHAGFMGVGAYTAAILSTRYGVNFIFTFIAATIVSGLFGIVIGLPSMRIRGRYLAIITLGFCEIARIVELNWMDLTRGPQGIAGIPKMKIFTYILNTPSEKYYVILFLLFILVLVVYAIINSRIGRAITAIRDDEIAAEVMGINVFGIKILVFLISSAFAGLAGAFYAHYMSFIDPNAFRIVDSFLVLSMIIFGGMSSIPGSIIGAIFLIILPEALRFLIDFRQIIYGFLIIIMLVFRPSGILGGYNFKHIHQQDMFRKTLKKATINNG